MQIETKITVRSQYSQLANTSIEIDSDIIDSVSLQHLIAGMVQSAIDRAEAKLEKQGKAQSPSEDAA